ncbi:MAG: penicillin-binding transpeptidase domain-containing protein [Sporichthyaceae bacterium]
MKLRRRTRNVAGLASLVVLMAGCGGPLGLPGGGDRKGEDAESIGRAFLDDWSAGRYSEAAARTSDPAKALAALEEIQTDLRPDSRTFAPKSPDCSGGTCRMDFDADLFLNALGAWPYQSSMTLAKQKVAEDDRWVVQWTPSVIHPRLADDLKLGRARGLPGRSTILDRNDAPLVDNQKVFKVGVAAGQVAEGAIETLAKLLDVNVDGLRTRTFQADDGQFVEAVVLRESDYRAKKSEIDAIGGVVVREDRLALAPTRQYARAVLGTVGNATAASLANAGPYASKADQVGSFGLQGLYQKQLAGKPRGRIELKRRTTDAVLEQLYSWEQVRGTPLKTTLDKRVQDAAEAAVALTGENSSVVAVDVRTGDILAVANGPAVEAGEDRAINGQYAPGSTFKILTAAALLEAGLEPSDSVDCPSSTTVDGKRFENYDGLGSLGRVSLRRAFAESCNTAFITEAMKLPEDALTKAAEAFGVGNDWRLTLSSYSGNVPPPNGPTDRAAAAIGQGRVLMSPLAMAMVAAAVASGTPREPRLLRSGPPPRETPTVTPVPDPSPSATPVALPPLEHAAELRELMFETVLKGTASILNVGPRVGAKTGTAEYGSETEPGKHAWMVGFVGDIAFAVIVERGDTGSKTAGPLARTFVERIGGYAVSGLRR